MTSIGAKLAKNDHKFLNKMERFAIYQLRTLCRKAVSRIRIHWIRIQVLAESGSASRLLQNPDQAQGLLWTYPDLLIILNRIQSGSWFEKLQKSSHDWTWRYRPCWSLRWTSNLVPSTGMGVSRSPRLKAASMLKLSSHPKGFHISGSWGEAQLD